LKKPENQAQGEFKIEGTTKDLFLEIKEEGRALKALRGRPNGKPPLQREACEKLSTIRKKKVLERKRRERSTGEAEKALPLRGGGR